ncbi:hypothetical protein O1611_g2500 [Lasiodiplodia mahajangana]|uniref:Uncharacterized protein n=1 Tax=Lasiodiplodia mahajangana TaxID=1108764 RepID=A0ACC2JUQ9_9PEZI|nr:hypothetical protein O1611_g2500 [Lasiodiplodia mahajangana]
MATQKRKAADASLSSQSEEKARTLAPYKPLGEDQKAATARDAGDGAASEESESSSDSSSSDGYPQREGTTSRAAPRPDRNTSDVPYFSHQSDSAVDVDNPDSAEESNSERDDKKGRRVFARAGPRLRHPLMKPAAKRPRAGKESDNDASSEADATVVNNRRAMAKKKRKQTEMKEHYLMYPSGDEHLDPKTYENIPTDVSSSSSDGY